MKLLIELRNTDDIQTLTEEVNGVKQYFIEGTFLQSNVKNRNGRVYPKEIMDREVKKYIAEFVDTSRAMGELDHPTNPSVNLKNVSHKIISLTESGNDWVGRAKIIDTPMGKIAKNLMDEGITFGVSSRALGSLRESNGIKVVQSDFMLKTPADLVSDPSAPDALVTNLMENKEWIWENGVLVEQEIEIKNNINNLSKKKQLTEEKLLEIFKHIISQIK